jgi:hypothetical protein
MLVDITARVRHIPAVFRCCDRRKSHERLSEAACALSVVHDIRPQPPALSENQPNSAMPKPLSIASGMRRNKVWRRSPSMVGTQDFMKSANDPVNQRFRHVKPGRQIDSARGYVVANRIA